MGSSDFNLLSLLFAGFAILVSVGTVAINLLLFIASDKRADEANRIATQANATANGANEISLRALDVSRFGLKREYQPALIGKGILVPYVDLNYHPTFNLINTGFGRTVIHKIEPLFRDCNIFLADREDHFPIALGYNQAVNLKIRFSKEFSNYLKTTAQINNDKPKDILISHTKGVGFSAFITDEPGTKYEAIFMYQANKTDEDDQSVDKIIYESLQSYLLEGTFKVLKIAEAAENDLHHFD